MRAEKYDSKLGKYCLRISIVFLRKKNESYTNFLIGRSKTKLGTIIEKIETKWMKLRKMGYKEIIKQHRSLIEKKKTKKKQQLHRISMKKVIKILSHFFSPSSNSLNIIFLSFSSAVLQFIYARDVLLILG